MDSNLLIGILLCVVSIPWCVVALVAKTIRDYMTSEEPVTLLCVAGDDVFEREWLNKPTGTHAELTSPIVNHLSSPVVKAAHAARRTYMRACLAQLQFEVGAVRVGDERRELQILVTQEFLWQAAFAMSFTDLMGIREKLLNDLKADSFLQWKNAPPLHVVPRVPILDTIQEEVEK